MSRLVLSGPTPSRYKLGGHVKATSQENIDKPISTLSNVQGVRMFEAQ